MQFPFWRTLSFTHFSVLADPPLENTGQQGTVKIYNEMTENTRKHFATFNARDITICLKDQIAEFFLFKTKSLTFSRFFT